MTQRRFQRGPADVVEVDVDAVRAQLAERFVDVASLVVERRVEAAFLQHELDFVLRDTAVDSLSAAVVAGLGGAFRPAKVVFVPDLPRTRSSKLMRRVVRAAWLGEDAGDLSTLVNPESVEAIRAAGR